MVFIMELLSNGFTLEYPDGTFPFSTDSMLLSWFAKLPRNASVLDLGSGAGTLGVLLCAKDSVCQVCGVELDPLAHAAAQENILRNALQSRVSSICADIRSIPDILPPGTYHCCISNPPYFSGGPASQTLTNARREDFCTLSDLFRSAAWSVRYGGDFFLVHRPERLAELIACAVSVKLEPKRLCLVRHRAGGPVSLILLSCRKGAMPGLHWEELCLFDAQGNPTPDYKSIYHI
jgi:tRNA1(Val) A37 N6-methylase TrmN6